MDGNKKIIRCGLGLAFVLLIGACAAPKTNYVSLYVETVRSDQDTLDADTTGLVSNQQVGKVVANNSLAGDTVIHKEELVMLEAVSVFLEGVHTRLDSIYYGIGSDTLSAENRYPNRLPSDSLQLKRNTVLFMNNKVVSQEQSKVKMENATVEKRVAATKVNQLDREKRVDLTPEITSTDDTIEVVTRQVEVQQKPKTTTKQVGVEKEVPVSAIDRNAKSKEATKSQEIKSIGETVEVGQRQVEMQQQQPKTIVENPSAEKVVPAPTLSARAGENNTAMQQQLDAKDGTIQELERQLKTQPQPIVKTERVYVDKMVPVVVSKTTRTETSAPAKQEPTKAIKETVVVDQVAPVVVPIVAKSEPNAAMKQELQVKKDSIQQLKKLLQAKQLTKTDTVYKMKESVEKAAAAIDTTTITAYYKIGQRTPNDGFLDSLLATLKEKTIRKVEISGFTDSSGNAAINRRLTDARINYIYSKLKPYVAVNKVFVQNFGQTFASENIVVEERRVEVKIYKER